MIEKRTSTDGINGAVPFDKRQPWLKFFPRDWQADEGLGQCSLAARGLWIELLAIMHKSPVVGHLLIAGKNPTPMAIALQVRADAKTVSKCLKELEEWNVFSRTAEGVIFSRRMIADSEKYQRDHLNGKSGGNPLLKAKDNAGVGIEVKAKSKPGVNPPDKARSQKPESEEESAATTSTKPASMPPASDPFPPYLNPPVAKPLARRDGAPYWLPLTREAEVYDPLLDVPGLNRWLERPVDPATGQRPPPAARQVKFPFDDATRAEIDARANTKTPLQIKALAGGWDIEEIATMVLDAAKIDPARWRGDYRPLIDWLQADAWPEEHILSAIKRIAGRLGYRAPASLNYFTSAVEAEKIAKGNPHDYSKL